MSALHFLCLRSLIFPAHSNFDRTGPSCESSKSFVFRCLVSSWHALAVTSKPCLKSLALVPLPVALSSLACTSLCCPGNHLSHVTLTALSEWFRSNSTWNGLLKSLGSVFFCLLIELGLSGEQLVLGRISDQGVDSDLDAALPFSYHWSHVMCPYTW